MKPEPLEKIKKEVLNRFKWKVDKKLEKIGDNNFIQTKHVVSLIKYFNDNLAKAIDLTIKKTTKNVKAAVQLVLKEIEKEKKKYAERNRGWTAEIIEGLEIAENKIKKAFSGVLEK